MMAVVVQGAMVDPIECELCGEAFGITSISDVALYSGAAWDEWQAETSGAPPPAYWLDVPMTWRLNHPGPHQTV